MPQPEQPYRAAKTTKKLMVSLPLELLAAVMQAATREGVATPEYVRRLLAKEVGYTRSVKSGRASMYASKEDAAAVTKAKREAEVASILQRMEQFFQDQDK